MKKSLVIIFFFVSRFAGAQTIQNAFLLKQADSLLRVKNYREAAITFGKAFRANGGAGYTTDKYNAACAWALSNQPDSAFMYLNNIVKYGYKNYDEIKNDKDLKPLYTDKRWKTLLSQVDDNKYNAEKNYNRILIKKLEDIYIDDQSGRLQLRTVELKYGKDSGELKELWKTINTKDSINTIKVKEILSSYGWPGPDVIGDQGTTTLFAVLQHSDQPTQEEYLPVMREAVAKGKASGSNLALLEDRLALKQNRKQIYGTQVSRTEAGVYYIAPLTDPDNVDKRRKSVGLLPLAEYVKHWQLNWDVEQYKKDLPGLKNTLSNGKDGFIGHWENAVLSEEKGIVKGNRRYGFQYLNISENHTVEYKSFSDYENGQSRSGTWSYDDLSNILTFHYTWKDLVGSEHFAKIDKIETYKIERIEDKGIILTEVGKDVSGKINSHVFRKE